ncbi:uncharacterized protein FOMMEDRAFT_164408 [Fomitiporia mediterranea MF3/22]|uniref:uncharacterized protein n=1 Tax=Fomitiporia mediterranea (strain MF3/22) TaxID=694068 RepID=UPI0004408DF0|nr:uncharacterized protein FOMMEDRAFT_164408 [Fomitiporia mediterranea MF3/22]EJD07436.1 hypothetical protein FOMMEDRAFT_164408 [Fomitiporia mediterranea MF3/22]
MKTVHASALLRSFLRGVRRSLHFFLLPFITMFNFFYPRGPIQLICNTGSALNDRNPPSDDLAVSSDAARPSPCVLDIIQKSVPSLCENTFRFKPPFAIANAHIQTLLNHLGQKDNLIPYDRHFVPADNGGTIAIDFASTPWLNGSAPIVIILPGLLGSWRDAYVKSATRELSRLSDGPVKGYRVVVVNSRGTPGNPLTSPHITHPGSTDDIRTAILYIRKSYPDAKGLFGLGFSMGGSRLTNYLAEEGTTCPLDAAFCISTVFDYLSCHVWIEEEHLLRRIFYSGSCGSRLTRMVREHENLFRDANSKGLDSLLSKRMVYMSTFNDTFMSYLAGYPDTPEFSADTSPIFHIGKIHRPCVLLNARDDPFYGGWCVGDVERVVRASGRKNLVLAITEQGGHVGWFQKAKDGRWEQWFVHPAREFFDAISQSDCWNNFHCPPFPFRIPRRDPNGMDEPDYVETSDQEELEIIRGMRSAMPTTPMVLSPMTWSPNLPRKRRKFSHNATESDDVGRISSGVLSSLDSGSTTPVPPSPGPGLPTSTTVLDDGLCHGEESLVDNGLNILATVDDEANYSRIFSQTLDNTAMDVAYDVHDTESEDELDIISRKLSQSDAGRTAYSPSRVLGLAKNHSDPSNSPTVDNGLGVSERKTHGRSHDPRISLLSSQLEDELNHESTSLDNVTSDPFSPQPARPSAERPRFSSSPPSSPRAPSLNPSVPQGSRYASPGHVGIVQPQSSTGNQDIGNSSRPAGIRESILQATNGEDDDINPRRYSLRARQARQLNPYEYDKRLYKQQMKRLPDAIVKVVSPRRHTPGRTHRHRHGSEDNDFIVSENEDETQGTARRNEKNRGASETLQEGYDDQEKSITWLPKAFNMSDDELSPLPPAVARKSPVVSASEDLSESHKSLHKKLQRFPLKEARSRREEHAGPANESEIETHGKNTSAITYARRKKTKSVFRDRSNSTIGGNAASLEDEARRISPFSAHQVDQQNGFGDAILEGEDDGFLHGDQNGDAHMEPAGITISSEDQCDELDDEDLASNGYASLRHGDVSGHNSPRHARSSSESTSVSDEDERKVELARRDRKRLRQLHRMMPAVMVARLSEQNPFARRRPARSRSKSAMSAGDNSGNDEHNSLAPGRSRIWKRSSTTRTGYIEGDSESSDLEPFAGNNRPENVVNVESSSESDKSVTSPSSTESNGDSLEQSVADAGYFDYDFSRQPMRWKEEPLIDHMLCRTRTKRPSSRKRGQTRNAGVQNDVGAHCLRSGGLEVNILPPRLRQRSGNGHIARTKQTRLPFESSPKFTTYDSDEDEINLARGETYPRGTEHYVGATPKPKEHEQAKKMTKKEKREAARKSTLHTFTSQRKGIDNGRRKGFMRVQIDMADDGLEQAFNPLHPTKTEQKSRPFIRAASAPKQRFYHRGNDGSSGQPALKQTSLHDYSVDDGPTTDICEWSNAVRQPGGRSATSVWHEDARVQTCTLDVNIAGPTPGLAFGGSTYLGKQLLPNLLDFVKNGILSLPNPYTGFGLIDLDANMSVGRLVDSLEIASNLLSEWLDDDSAQATDEDNVRRHEHMIHSLCHFTAWVYTNYEERETIHTAVSSCAARITEKLREKVGRFSIQASCLNIPWLAVIWFVVEITTVLFAAARRQALSLDTSCCKESLTLLIKSLKDYGMGKALDPIEAREVSSPTVPLRIAELWVCLIHLLPEINVLYQEHSGNDSVFWSLVLPITKDDKESTLKSVEFSERLWKFIFGLSALSHFSTHGIATTDPRLPPSWEIVGLALDAIRLTHDSERDSFVPRESLKRRDRYVRMVVARCFLLGTKWKWPLADAHAMFKRLVDIFRSRNFSNLLGEESEFPAFLRYHDLALLDELRTSDTAFGLYLKLVMKASKSDSNASKDDARSKARQAKLLSLAVPLSGVAFSRAQPPTTDELSMLINRFSAIIIAILVDGKETPNIDKRISHARRFINFVDADDRSRDICIKAAMYIVIAANHLYLGLDRPLAWLGEMCQTLLDEFQRASAPVQAKEPGARKADNNQDKPTMRIEESNPRYPDIGLLCGPWIKVFSMRELTNMVTTRIQILQLVQSFLQARAKVFPSSHRLAHPPGPEENSESQEAYGDFGFDDEILAALPMDGEQDENSKKDKEVAKVVNADVIPHIFRLLLQYFNDPTAYPSDEGKLEDFWANADDWIDCWVGCAAIVVRNEIRTWDDYLNIGSQSWSAISDSFFRRRVAVRFMHQLLKCDPKAYNKDRERHFLGVLLQSLVSFKVTMEHEYSSILFSVDGLRHTMLRDVPVTRAAGKDGLHLTRTDFLHVREDIITRIFSNLNMCLLSNGSERDKNVFVECVVDMLSSMQDIWRNLRTLEDRDKYSELCRHVFSNIRKHVRVQGLPRLATYLAWGASFDKFDM